MKQVSAVSAVSAVTSSTRHRGVLRNSFSDVLSELDRRCPDFVETDRWRQCVTDAQRFLADWGDQAAALGWTADDLFGLHPVPERPALSYCRLARYDCTGLLWLLQGRPVIALTDTTATIRTPSGGTGTYRKDCISYIDARKRITRPT